MRLAAQISTVEDVPSESKRTPTAQVVCAVTPAAGHDPATGRAPARAASRDTTAKPVRRGADGPARGVPSGVSSAAFTPLFLVRVTPRQAPGRAGLTGRQQVGAERPAL